MNMTMNLRRLLNTLSIGILVLVVSLPSQAAVTLEKTYKVADNGLYFNGVQSKSENPPNKANPDVLDINYGCPIKKVVCKNN